MGKRASLRHSKLRGIRQSVDEKEKFMKQENVNIKKFNSRENLLPFVKRLFLGTPGNDLFSLKTPHSGAYCTKYKPERESWEHSWRMVTAGQTIATAMQSFWHFLSNSAMRQDRIFGQDFILNEKKGGPKSKNSSVTSKALQTSQSF